MMGLLAIVGSVLAVGLAVGDHEVLALGVYLLAGAAWIRHDRMRPLEELPMWVSGGRLVAVLIWLLWPFRALEAAWHWFRRLKSADRFLVGPERHAEPFGTWDEALARAREQASSTGESVPVTDRAMLVGSAGLDGPRRHWTSLVTPDGAVQRRAWRP